MTLLIGVATGDGIVLAADSRTTIGAPAQPLRVLSDSTRKLFNVGGCAVGTSGWAFLLNRNIAGHVGDLARSLDDERLAPSQVCVRLATTIGPLLERHLDEGLDARPAEGEFALSFLVGGYDGNEGEVYELNLPGGQPERVGTTKQGAAMWRGQTDVVTRLIKGWDPTLPLDLEADPVCGPARDDIMRCVEGTEYILRFALMSLQDAIDLALLLIRTTIDVQRLTHGTLAHPGSWPGVGGSIAVAAVTPTDGFGWVQETRLAGERPSGTQGTSALSLL